MRRNVKILQQQLKRRDVKIENLNHVLDLLKKKCNNYEKLKNVININFSNIFDQFNIKKSDQGARYTDDVKSFALTVYFYSAKAYRFLRNYLHLPHPSTLRRLLSTHNCNVGFMSEVLDYLKTVAAENDSLKNVALIFDAMSIRTELRFDLKTDKYWGYVDYGGIMTDDSETLATEVLIFQIVSYTEKFKCPIAYFLTNKIGADLQTELILAAIRLLSGINITVKSITCDGTVTNLKTFELLGCNFSYPDMKTSFPHPKTNCEVHCIMDPPHMLKLCRNVFAETKLTSEKGDIDFNYIKQLHRLQDEEGLKLANKLSSTHVTFYNKKMNVRLAAQLLSSSVADAIDFLRLSGNSAFKGSEATVEFIRIIDRVFDLFNCKNPYGKGFKSPMRLENHDTWSNILKETRVYLGQLKINGEGILTHRRRTPALGFIIDTISFTNLALDLLQNGVVKYFLTYKTSQDHLEMFFSCLRAAGGHNDNPSALQVRYALRKLLFRNSVTPSINANCTSDDYETTPVLEFRNAERSIIDSPISTPVQNDNEEHEIECLLQLVEATSLTEYKNNVLYYIAGYIVNKLLEKMSCRYCISALLSNKLINKEHDYAVDINKHSSFTSFIDRGGLKHVSKFVFDVICYTEKVFTSMVSNSMLNTTKSKISMLVVQHFYSKLDELIDPPHPVNSITCEDRHDVALVKCLINKYLNLRLTTYGKHKTLKIIGARATLRQKLHKTILFSNI